MTSNESPAEREARLLAEAEAEFVEELTHLSQEEIAAMPEIDQLKRPRLGIADAISALFRIIRP